MVPELAVAMLACARLGAVHSVVFGGFSSDALRDRILDGASAWVVTAQVGHRGGRAIPLRATTDAAVAQCACVRAVFVFRNGGPPVAARDAAPGAPHAVVDMEAALPGARPFCAAVAVDAEDPLFLLYTSGSTGKPKGLAHSTAGYLLMASLTHKIVFDVRPGDVYACVADAGWITGHSYVVYGPLANGASTLMFESTPLYPDASRYWDVVQRHRVTQFYTAPTAIRALMRFGAAPVDKHDLSSLRVLGSVGEPINPEAWRWYHAVVGKGRCAIVDTFWQTETGGIMITPLPGATPTKPGAASLPFFGVVPQLRDRAGAVVEGNDATGVLCMAAPWPGLARTIYKDHDRYLATYMRPFPGVYFTGDGAYRDKDGYYWITGRVDGAPPAAARQRRARARRARAHGRPLARPPFPAAAQTC
jgi:acetyl-CoA synthetase